MNRLDWLKIVDYNQDTGKIIWLSRGDDYYSNKSSRKRFNTWRAGKEATSANTQGYKTISHNGKTHLAHRVVWCIIYGGYPVESIDHINHDRGDNRSENLATVGHIENMQNQRLRPDNKSGFTGVHFDKNCKKWRASIVVGKKRVNLGSYESLADAVSARKSANRRYGFHFNHGEKL